MKPVTVAILVAAALQSTACLQKDTTSTIHLRQDGSFDWVVLQQNVRSDESDEAARLTEERAYVDDVNGGEHNAVAGLLALGANDVRVRWLRDRRPYAVMVDARFDSATNGLEGFLTKCGVPHGISLSEANGIVTWRLWIDLPPDSNAPDGNDAGCGDNSLEGLNDALDVTIILESGAFTSATGFILKGADTAVVDEERIEEAAKTSGRVELSLSWKAR